MTLATPLTDRFNHLYQLIGSDRFLKQQGFVKDTPFFICPHHPSEAVAMERMIQHLINKLSQTGVQVLEINLYDLAVEILKTNDDWDWYLAEEPRMTKQELQEELQSILDIETVFIPAMAQKIAQHDHDVLFMTGVGEVYPYIRSHNVLNNLQRTVKEHPLVMFFPGAYTHSPESGASLDLFGRKPDDKYYRASNIYDCQI